MPEYEINKKTLCAADEWIPPSSEDIREVLRRAELSGSQAANYLGLGQGGGRTIRRWVSGDSKIPYAAWALLCHAAGFGEIWKR